MESTTTVRLLPLREPDLDRLRQPPANTEAEQALLGAMLINNAAYHRVAEFLLQEHFGNAVHGRIYAAIGKLIERGLIADPVTLKNLFDQDGALAEIGGAQYLAQLVNAAVTIINAEHYGRTIHDLYLRRELITVGQDVVTEAFQHDLDDPATEQIERAEAKLFELASSGQAEGGPQRVPHRADQRDHDGAGRLQARRQDRRRRDRLHRSRQEARRAAPVRPDHPGRATLDGQDGAGDQHRVQRRESLSAGARAGGPDRPDKAGRGRRGRRFFSLEMSAEQLATRILAEESGTSSDRIRRGEVRREDFDKFVVASQRLVVGAAVYRRHAGPVGRGLAHPGAAPEAAARARADRRSTICS